MGSIIRTISIVICVALLPAAIPVHAVQSGPEPTGIVKSPADTREYRALTLENGLKVMLVSDATADRAAAALDVHVGSGHDPEDRQGLAHYLEHMLFLGTQRYPRAGEYQEYINQHGGSNNAYTTLEHTNYFFNITPEYFEGALDRFAQFFIAPLFNEEYVKRERAVVESEYRARKDDEGRRLWTARRTLYNPEHPSTKFSVGSLETLADRKDDPVRDDLIAFYKRYYHASRMALSVISPHSLDQLQAWVEKKFSATHGEGDPYTPFAQPLVLEADLPLKLMLKPIKDIRKLTFSFPVESVESMEDSKPGSYLSNLLGHEGEGSLLALLKSRSWANSLSAGMGYSDQRQATFDISISLSDKGAQHVEEIGSLVFAFIELIRLQGVKPLYFEELRQLAELEFRYQEKVAESQLVQRLASRLHRYRAEEVLSVPFLFQSFKPERVERILDQMRVDRLQLVITDPQLQSAQTTPWYDVAYSIDAIEPAWLETWRNVGLDDALALPEPNPFIAQQLELLPDDMDAALPVKLETVPEIELWHQTELGFGQPRAELYFSLRSIEANASPRQAVLTDLYVMAVREALNTYSYPAMLAGLKYRIYSHSRGLSVRISGYSEKQVQLLEKVIDGMWLLDIDAQRFELYLENARQGLENSLKGRPSARVINGAYDVLLSSSWSTEEQLEALQSIDLAALQKHARALLENPQLLMLSVGNVEEQDSLNAAKQVARLRSKQRPLETVSRARVRKIEAGQWILNHSEALPKDAAMALIFQGESTRLEELAMTQMLGALIHTPYYQALRTEAQLGYIVQAFAFNILDTPALGFSIQSNSHSVGNLVTRTERFLENYQKQLEQLPVASYESTRAGLIAQLSEEEKQLSDMATRYWTELDRESYDFDTLERLIVAIEGLEKQELIEYFDKLVKHDSSSVLLSVSYGDQSQEIAMPKGLRWVQYPSLDEMRVSLQEFF